MSKNNRKMNITRLIFRTMQIVILGLCASAASAKTKWNPVSYDCAEYANFADELEISGFNIISQSDAGNGLVDVVIGAELKNQDVGLFENARLAIDFRAAGFHPALTPQPMTFGSIKPKGSAIPDANLQLRLPSTEVPELLDRLNSGKIALTVNAAERAQLADDVAIYYWDLVEETNFLRMNPLVVTPPISYFNPQIVEHFPDIQLGERVYMTVEPDFYLPQDVPQEIWNLELVGVFDPSKGKVVASPRSIDPAQHDLTTTISTGSFCTSRSDLVDLPVQASRLREIDGVTQDDEERDRHPQPMRFNDLNFDGIQLSGQISAQVLRPRLHIRIRQGRVKINSDFDSHLSLVASLTAKESRTFSREVDLYHFCFPLPELNLGPFLLYPNITLEQQLGLDASLTAGMQMGIQKSFRSTQSIGYDPERIEPFYTSSRFDQTPLDFTPPRLTDDTQANAEVWTSVRAALNLELISTYPDCQNGLGSYVNVRAGTEFTVDPQVDAWWKAQPSLNIGGGIGIDFFGLRAYHDAETRNYLDDLVAQAKAPAQKSLPAKSQHRLGDGRQSGEGQRWIVSTRLHSDDINTQSIKVEHADVAATDDGVVAVSHDSNLSAHNRLYKWDRFGALQWAKAYKSVQYPKRVLPQANGELLVAGNKVQGAGIWLARHDRAGNVLWSKKHRVLDPDADPVFHCVLEDIVDFDAGTEQQYLAVGVRGAADPRQSDGCIVRLAGDGSVLWAKIYDDVKDMLKFKAVTVTRDGHFVVAGVTGAGPEPDGANVNNPFVMKIDADGVVQWAKTVPLDNRGAEFLGVTEGHDGRYYMAGGGGATVRETGSLLVARIDSDGSDARHAILLHDSAWEIDLDNAWRDKLEYDNWILPDSLYGAYDQAYDVTAVSDGIVVAGRSAAGANATAWVIKLNDNLGVQWHAFFDGDGNDGLYSIANTGDGLLLAGTSSALLSEGDVHYPSLLTMKMPYEGHITLPDGSSLLSRYAEPGILDSSSHPDIVIGLTSGDITLIVQDAIVEQTDDIADLLHDDDAMCVQLLTTGTFHSGHVSYNDACAQDSDGDGLSDDVEDVNRNYIVDAEETDPFNRDTDGDGISDADDPAPRDPAVPDSPDDVEPDQNDSGGGSMSGFMLLFLGLLGLANLLRQSRGIMPMDQLKREDPDNC